MTMAINGDSANAILTSEGSHVKHPGETPQSILFYIIYIYIYIYIYIHIHIIIIIMIMLLYCEH